MATATRADVVIRARQLGAMVADERWHHRERSALLLAEHFRRWARRQTDVFAAETAYAASYSETYRALDRAS